MWEVLGCVVRSVSKRKQEVKWQRKARLALVDFHRTQQAECSQGKGQGRGRGQWSKNEAGAVLLPKQRPIRNIIQIRKSKVLT